MRLRGVVLLVLCFVLILFSIKSPVYADQVTINTDNLNVRSGPGTSFDRVGKVHTNEIYSIIQKQNDWVQIQLDEGTGWVTVEYITITEDQPEEKHNTKPVSEKTISVKHDKTQIRNGPTTEYDIIHFAGKGTKLEVISESEEWYEVKNETVKGYVLKKLVDKPSGIKSTNIKNKTIIVDAGHGGRDVGSIGANDSYEKNLTYRTSMQLAQKLSILGAEVIFTRDADEFISLASRASLSNTLNTDAFLSIHYNSTPGLPSVTGIESFYQHEQNKPLAHFIQQEIIKQTGDRDRKISKRDLQVLRQNFKPAVLLELGFLSNVEKEELLLTNAYQKKLVAGIINGLNRYFAHH